MRKPYNPKSHQPAVYIPCWLIQVPNNLLSFAAKCLYGRLSQWSNAKGEVFRSYNQLAQEIGSTKRSICDYVKELKDAGLINTHQPIKGGLNHFTFLEHSWMNEPINAALCYKVEEDPTQESAHPHAESCTTPTQNPARINIKEIKRNNNNPSISPLSIFEINLSNPFNIPEDLIQEWQANRKKYPVTRTVWTRVNKILLQLRERGISPIEAFERMVASGWRSIEVSWFEQEIKAKQSKQEVDFDSHAWGQIPQSWVKS